ncbi:putative aminotransferase YhxA [Alicyclobacillus cellulosilyticus]|uniref:Aminotransferase YhxA n=1 Tax=Alicyclobacillus cellulosilyticus TaxID=1003997 RepID=A0A917K3W8_9BACL|nr:aspartate aminotransferase family protein [Alicyclobacillus cellulosilyticus]GGJ00079.1 putative aminotransferase YhxA [Alicyclobacillus cellulosilyticus]
MRSETAKDADTQGATAAQRWLEQDRRYVWHHMQPYAASRDPMIVVHGEGATITDIHGNRYIDAMSGLWCVNLGYSERELAEAAYRQLAEMPYYPLTQSHLPAIRLAEKLNAWLGGEYKIFFSNSGSEANETAFKLARQYHAQRGEPGRWKVISRYRAYHGNSGAALAATGQAQRKYKYEPLAPGFVHVPPPYCYRCPFGQAYGSCHLECASVYEQVMEWEGPETIAAVIMEPVITGGGVIVPPPEYMRQVREICDRYGVLLIVDEVICGFGRSGERFGHHNFGVEPDIVTMAKGITSGYLPLSATAVRASLFEAFKDDAPYAHFRHVNTFGGNPAACALAVRTLEIMEERRLVERARELGRALSAALVPLAAHPNVGDVRSFGFLAGIELVADKETRSPAPAAFVNQVLAGCKRRGVIIGKNGDTVPNHNNVLTISPPFVVSREELDQIVQAVTEAVHEAAEGAGPSGAS